MINEYVINAELSTINGSLMTLLRDDEVSKESCVVKTSHERIQLVKAAANFEKSKL
jgi:hypothetical protein